jgi:hypothetical protein
MTSRDVVPLTPYPTHRRTKKKPNKNRHTRRRRRRRRWRGGRTRWCSSTRRSSLRSATRYARRSVDRSVGRSVCDHGQCDCSVCVGSVYICSCPGAFGDAFVLLHPFVPPSTPITQNHPTPPNPQTHTQRLILKSPAHTARMKLLHELFPGAKFIHISRNPYEVYQSTQKLFMDLLIQVRGCVGGCSCGGGCEGGGGALGGGSLWM